jgi:hypothetical protein
VKHKIVGPTLNDMMRKCPRIDHNPFTARKQVTDTFPWRWIPGNQLFMEHVSWNTKMKDVSMEIDS